MLISGLNTLITYGRRTRAVQYAIAYQCKCGSLANGSIVVIQISCRAGHYGLWLE